MELIAKTFQGLEEVLAQELTELGANNVQIGRRMVSFTGDKEMLYRANFCLRTAVRVLMPIKHFKAKDADDVYKAVRAVDWNKYLDIDTTFAVDSVVYSDEFRHSKFVAYKVKDAIVDYFRETTGERPNIRITNPDVKLNIHIAEDDCTLSLDSSGESLHQRGYRVATVEAPINEVLAAGLLKMAGWNGETDLVDPFCGSGTLLIEAALMARNIYPGVFRKEFGFEKWKNFDRDLFDAIYNDDSQEREFAHHIYGYDINRPTVDIALRNAKSAGVAGVVSVEQRDFRDFKKPEGKTLMVTNPPYGARLTTPDLLGLYQDIGKVLKHEFAGNEAWIISSKEELFENIGLRPSFKVQVLNGAMDCDFRKYQLFDGKLDEFRSEGGTVKTDEERRLMSDGHRFRTRRDDFKERFTDEDKKRWDDNDEDDLPEGYALLRRKHREFEQTRFGRPDRPAREGGYGDRPPRRDGFRKEGFHRDGFRKDGDGFRREGGFKREGGFRRDNFRKDGDSFRKDGDGFRREGGFKREGGFRRDNFRKDGDGFRKDGDSFRREGGFKREGGFRHDNFRKDGDSFRKGGDGFRKGGRDFGKGGFDRRDKGPRRDY